VFDVAVIGAGVSGAAIARQLAAHAVTVALVERAADVSFGVSKANSGIIHAAFHHKGTTLKARLEAAGNPMFDRLQAELGFPFRRVGIVVAAFSEEEMKTVEVLHERGVENGSPGIEIVGRDRLLALEPRLSPDVRGGLFAPSGGIIEPYRFVFNLVENAVANGVTLLTNWKAASGRQVDGAWQIESDRDERIQARWVVNAAGLHADEVSAAFGAEHYAITPRKGEEYILERGSAGFPSRVIFPVPTRNSKGTLVIPTVEGTMMLGPTAEEMDDKSDVATTPENLERVFDLAARMVPVVSRRDIITSFAGLRPTLPGDDFYIERSREVPRFVQVAGIQSPGLTASPAIAERVVALLREDGLSLAPRPDFDPCVRRPARIREILPGHREELERLVAEDPSRGHVVCRCETVSEAEVVEAIRKGHTTLDGIKFYTRAGQGRCQGGFCTYRIMQILARETGKPLEAITKRGGGSALVVGRIGRGLS
jgi:glycerol-3-phosphate dehydrogenase